METLYERIIRQLDTLVPFLALAHEEAFNLISRERQEWFTSDQVEAIPHSYNEYRTQVAHSAFLLGYSYFEVFLGDLVREILRRRPNILPQERELKYRDILDRRDYESILQYMIEKEVLTIFYGSAEKIAENFKGRLNLQWPQYDGRPAFVEVSRIRNCIIHNGARVETRLAEISTWNEGDDIKLTPSDVHSYGIQARLFAYSLWQDALDKHLNDSIISSS